MFVYDQAGLEPAPGTLPWITVNDQASNSVVHSSWLDVLTDPVRLSVLRSLVDLGEGSAADLIADSHVSDPTLRRHLDAMVALGLVHEHRVRSDGHTPGRPAARFSLDPDVRDNAIALFKLLERPIGAAIRRTRSPRQDR